MPTALLLENIHPQATTVLDAAGVEVLTRSGALGEDELTASLGGVQLLGIRSTTRVTQAVLDAAPDLVAIGAFCIGVNQIDLAAAARRGVAVFNAPFSNTRSVVELALAEVIALTRRLTEFNAALHAGVWEKSATGAHEVRGRRLGIVGYGNIGSQLSVLAEALGMTVGFYDTAEKLALGNARRFSSLEEVLAWADVVTLHVDGREGNGGLFGDEQFSRMRPGGLFLNLSRGFVVDHEALHDHLVSGHLAGAAVDVFPEEPARRGDPFSSLLRGLPNVVLTPHIGGSTEEAQEDIGRFVAGKLRDYATSGSTSLSVNLPQVVPDRVQVHRLAHLHRNVPGVLAKANSVLADHGVNVVGQQLTTRGELGYVLTDVPGRVDDDVVAALQALPETVRLRVLPA
ncbi:phosphoglycerate dehydrogenase [Quadrisphaera sp. DSM 44207]|uniref:phosphoglycerate dehydrogenase n=1 Tax=Quadrisphaera sp. DSM 44207 TaxID=1881057 RepID=UPI00088BCAAB|nr:phosphoglycerate dehydrogenase [Quadrisphaera sp. DSM 44207]SDQ38408.1 D-3-phosphoglycerate dehydrogenase [Quadrisphaera sp. DSM 44207]